MSLSRHLPPPEEYFPNLDFPCVKLFRNWYKSFQVSKIICHGGFECVEFRRLKRTHVQKSKCSPLPVVGNVRISSSHLIVGDFKSQDVSREKIGKRRRDDWSWWSVGNGSR